MNKPKLREGADRLILEKLTQLQGTDGQFALMQQAVEWTLNNLDKLLEPRDQPLVNGKRVAIVEVGE